MKMFFGIYNCLLFGSGFVSGLPEPEAGLGVDMVSSLIRVKRGGACTSTADCVSGNVCSKWGWCQWTNIYGSDGPSQGAAAPGEGKAGQCVTSADCASRVPYCSKLGFCHGGRLPFDEAQLEIPGEDKEGDTQPQGFINNNPSKNNPALKSSAAKTGGGTRGGPATTPRPDNRKTNNNNKSSSTAKQQSNTKKGTSPASSSNIQRKNGGGTSPASSSNIQRKNGGGNSDNSSCPGGALDKCIETCIPIEQIKAYGTCVEQCGKRC